MELINQLIVVIIKDNGLMINMKVMDNITPKIIISFSQVILKTTNHKENIFQLINKGKYLRDFIIKDKSMENQQSCFQTGIN